MGTNYRDRLVPTLAYNFKRALAEFVGPQMHKKLA